MLSKKIGIDLGTAYIAYLLPWSASTRCKSASTGQAANKVMFKEVYAE